MGVGKINRPAVRGEGRKARDLGRSLDSNPYNLTVPKRRAWYEGWMERNTELREEAEREAEREAVAKAAPVRRARNRGT